MNTYALVTVEVPEHTKQKRIVIKSYSNGYSGQSFQRSGKNCNAPKGQVWLLPYRAVIGDLIKKLEEAREFRMKKRLQASNYDIKPETADIPLTQAA